MKVAPVSADLLIKLGLFAGAGIALYLLAQKVSSSLPSVAPGALNPASSDNLVNQGVTSLGGALVGSTGPGRNADGSWTFGGWIYDVTH